MQAEIEVNEIADCKRAALAGFHIRSRLRSAGINPNEPCESEYRPDLHAFVVSQPTAE